MDQPIREEGKTGRRAGLWTYAIALAASMLVHGPSLFIPFQFDDFHHLAENPGIMRLSNLPKFFVDPGLFTGRAGVGMYRPLLMAGHALVYSMFGLDYRAFHVVNLLLHLVNCALVLTLLRRWTGRDLAALAGTMFWSLAAVQHESVGYLSARSTLQSSVFMLSALLLTDRDRGRNFAAGALAGLFCVLGLLSKEVAFVLPLLILLRDLTLGREQGMKLSARWPIYACTFALMPLYIVLRRVIFSSALGPILIPRQLYIITQTRVFFYYLAEIFLPVQLTLFPDQPLVTAPFTAVPLLCMAGALGLAAIGVLAFKKHPRISFGIFFAGICLLPTSSLVPLFLTASIERLYLPLLGFIVTAIYMGDRLFGSSPKRARTAALLVPAILVMNAGIVIQRHRLWQDGVRLMRDVAEKSPQMSSPWAWLGTMELQKRDFVPAKKHLSLALRMNPEDFVAQENFGKLMGQSGSGENAREIFYRFLNDPASPKEQKVSALFQLAMLDLKEKRPDPAREKAREILKLDPDNADAYMALGQAAEDQGNIEEAKKNYRRALELYPEYLEVASQLGIIAYKEQDFATARKYLLLVAAKDKPWPEVYSNLGLIAFREAMQAEAENRTADAQANFESAKKWFERGLHFDPEYAYCHYGMGGYYGMSGDLAKAQKEFEQAIAKKPDFFQARDFLIRTYLDRVAKNQLGEETREWYLDRAAAEIKALKAQATADAQTLAAQREKEWTGITGQPLP